MDKKIAIIGMGHLGKALQQGLLASGIKKRNLLVSNSSEDNRDVAARADWIILAVKPVVVSSVIREIQDLLAGKLIISAAAGVSLAHLKAYTKNSKQQVIRIMPNLPVAYQQGIIGIYASSRSQFKSDFLVLIARLGTVIEVKKEADLESVTLLAGCGPAIVAYCISMLMDEGIAMGLSKKNAELTALQTYHGTLAYLELSGLTPKKLQKFVATKGGVTEEIIAALDKSGMPFLFAESLRKGKARIDALKASL